MIDPIVSRLENIQVAARFHELPEILHNEIMKECLNRHAHLKHMETRRRIAPQQWEAWVETLPQWRSALLENKFGIAWNSKDAAGMEVHFSHPKNDYDKSERLLRRIFDSARDDADSEISAQVKIWGSAATVQDLHQQIGERFPLGGPIIRWFYDTDEAPVRLPVYPESVTLTPNNNCNTLFCII